MDKMFYVNHSNESDFKMSYEDELILCCANVILDDKQEARIKNILSNNLNWSDVLKKAGQNRVKHLLYIHLCDQSNLMIPQYVITELKNYYMQNIKKNLFLWGELKIILRKFDEYGIAVIPYKGPILSFVAFNNLGLRYFNDLDVIVEPKDVPLVRRILFSIGYEPELKINSSIESKFLNYQKEYKFINKEKKIVLDLHLRFTDLFLPHSSKWNSLNKNILENIEIDKTNLNAMPIEDMFIIICLHNYSHQWNTLSLLVDLSELIKIGKGDINWFKIKKMAISFGIKKIILINLYLLNVVLNFDTNNMINELCSNSSLNKIEKMSFIIKKRIFSDYHINSRNNLSKIFRDNIKYRDNIFLGFMDCFKDIFVPTNYDLEKIRLHPSFFFLYSIIRPFFLLIRYKI